jgi:hypothetical protein
VKRTRHSWISQKQVPLFITRTILKSE